MTEALRLTTHFGERDRADGRLLSEALLDVYGADRIRASLLLRGTAGFGRVHHLHTDRLLSHSLSGDLPVVAVAVDIPERIRSTLDRVLEIQRRGLITLERARLVAPDPPTPAGPATRSPIAPETKLTVFIGRRDRAGGQPAFVEVCELLHSHGIAGASVLLGVDGTSHGRRARAAFFASNADVPMIVVAVGSLPAISGMLPKLRRLVPAAQLVLEDVRVCKRDGVLLAGPHELPGTDETGRSIWQRLTLYTSESATRDGRTIHLELIRRLRETGAAGATSVRGIWGFHGDHAPHGDRLLQLRRRVPVVTTLIDSPSQISRYFETFDALTAETGLVTSEAVPAMLALSADHRIGGLDLARLS